MIRTNILDKINVLINIVSKEQFMVLMLVLYLLLALILLTCSKLTKKSAKKVLACWYTFMLTTIAFEYRDKLSGLLDYLVNNIIYELVFPNYLVFILIFVITNIYIVDSIINKNSTLVNKIINLSGELSCEEYFHELEKLELLDANKTRDYTNFIHNRCRKLK